MSEPTRKQYDNARSESKTKKRSNNDNNLVYILYHKFLNKERYKSSILKSYNQDLDAEKITNFDEIGDEIRYLGKRKKFLLEKFNLLDQYLDKIFELGLNDPKII